jgi:hypothetical protein
VQHTDGLLRQVYPDVFSGGQPINGKLTTITAYQLAEQNNVQMQLFMKAATNNSLIERDRLLEYSVGSYYNELSLFIKQSQKSNKNMDI